MSNNNAQNIRWVRVLQVPMIFNPPPLYSLLAVLSEAGTKEASKDCTVRYKNEVWVHWNSDGNALRLIHGEYEYVEYTDFIDCIDIAYTPVSRHQWGVKAEWKDLYT